MLICAPRYSSSVAMTRKIIAQDDPRGPGVRAEEPRPRPSRCGLLRSRITVNVTIPASTPTANRSSMNPIDGPVPDPGDRERPGEQVPVRLDDRQQQHDETPERRRVRRPGHRPLQQLALPDHLGSLDLRIPARDARAPPPPAPARAARSTPAASATTSGAPRPPTPPRSGPGRRRSAGPREPPQYPELKRSGAGVRHP